MNVARQLKQQLATEKLQNGKNELTNNFMSHNDESFVMLDAPPGTSAISLLSAAAEN